MKHHAIVYKIIFWVSLVIATVLVTTFILWNMFVWPQQMEHTARNMKAGLAELERGNYLLRAGKSRDAILAYSNALALRPEWGVARDNIRIANERLLIQEKIEYAKQKAIVRVGKSGLETGN